MECATGVEWMPEPIKNPETHLLGIDER